MTRNRRRSWPLRIVDAVNTLAGLFMAVTPLLLWVSPATIVFQAVLLICLICCILVVLLAQIREANPAPQSPRTRPRTRPWVQGSLPPELIERLQNHGEMSRRQLPILKQIMRGWFDRR